MVSVSCFGGVRVTLCLFIILLVLFGLLSGHLLGNSCPLGYQFVFIVFCLLVIFISRFGFKSGICLLIAPVPLHCFSITSIFSARTKYYGKNKIAYKFSNGGLLAIIGPIM